MTQMALETQGPQQLTPTQSIAGWLGHQLQARGERTIKLLELRCKVGRNADDVVRTLPRPGYDGEPGDDWQPEQYMTLADEIVLDAQTYADGGSPGWHNFELVARTMLGREMKTRFRLHSGGDLGAELDDGGLGLGAGGAGVLAAMFQQQIKHNEFMMQIVGRQTETLMRTAIAERGYTGRLLEEVFGAYEHVRQANLKLAAGERELVETEHKEKRKDLLTGQIGGLAMGALTNFLKSKGLGENPFAEIEGLIDSLTPDQLVEIAQKLRPEQRVALGKLLEARQKAQAAKAQEQAKKEG